MMIIKYLVLLFCGLIFGPQGHTQVCTLKGKVMDHKIKEPLPYVNVMIYTKDSVFVKGGLTDREGDFVLKEIAAGEYILYMHSLGYKSLKIPVVLSKNEVNIGLHYLNVSSKQLDEVVVVGKNASITYKVDRKVIDASSFPGAIVALDLLENVPSLQIGVDGTLSYRGGGAFTVFMNGKPTSNGMEKLRQLPADKIDKIEIITNPSAKYEAEGMAGIINVILRKKRLEGYVVNASLSTNTSGGYEALFSVDRKQKKWGWYISGQLADYIKEKRKITTDKFIADNAGVSWINESIKEKSGNKRSYIEVSGNYVFSDRDYIDFSCNVNPMKSRDYRKNRGYLTADSLQTFLWETENRQTYQYYGVSFNYEHTFNNRKEHVLSVFVDYSSYLRTFRERQLDTRITEGRIERAGYEGSEGDEQSFKGKLNYALPLSSKHILEAGADISTNRIFDIKSVSGLFDEKGNITPFPDEMLTTHIDFQRDIYMGYLISRNEWKKWQCQFGIRFEWQTASYYKKTMDFFPSGHVLYNFSEDNQLTVSYSRRIVRPSYWNVIPVKQYDDVNSFYVGNADLKSSISDNYEINYKRSWDRDFLGCEMFARKINNVIETCVQVDSSGSLLLYSPRNVGKLWNIGIEVMGEKRLWKWWDMNLSVSCYHQNLSVKNADLGENKKQMYVDSYLNNTFSLNTFLIKWAFSYKSPLITSQSHRTGYFYSDLSLKKSFMKGRWSVTLICKNMFATLRYDLTQKGDDFSIYKTTKVNPMGIFKFSYTFNKQS